MFVRLVSSLTDNTVHWFRKDCNTQLRSNKFPKIVLFNEIPTVKTLSLGLILGQSDLPPSCSSLRLTLMSSYFQQQYSYLADTYLAEIRVSPPSLGRLHKVQGYHVIPVCGHSHPPIKIPSCVFLFEGFLVCKYRIR